MSVTLAQAQSSIVAIGRWMDGKGWAPATAGNYSMRLDDGSFAVTVSGRHKGRLTAADVMRVDAAGRSLDGQTRCIWTCTRGLQIVARSCTVTRPRPLA
jgi:methylthioribulose-1-phosphate dehydratase